MYPGVELWIVVYVNVYLYQIMVNWFTTSSIWVFIDLHLFKYIVSSGFSLLADLMDIKCPLTVVFICISLITNEIGQFFHLFNYHSAFLFHEMPFHVFWLFFHYSLIDLYEYLFWNSPFRVTWVAMFSSNLWLSLSLSWSLLNRSSKC